MQGTTGVGERESNNTGMVVTFELRSIRTRADANWQTEGVGTCPWLMGTGIGPGAAAGAPATGEQDERLKEKRPTELKVPGIVPKSLSIQGILMPVRAGIDRRTGA